MLNWLQTLPNDQLMEIIRSLPERNGTSNSIDYQRCCWAAILAHVLGSGIKTKGILYSLLRYMTKSPVEITQSLFLFKNVRFSMDHHSSQADGVLKSESPVTLFFIQVANKMNGCVEMSAMMISLALLGAPKELS